MFHVKDLIIFTFYVKLSDDRRKSEQEKILSHENKSFKALAWKIFNFNQSNMNQ